MIAIRNVLAALLLGLLWMPLAQAGGLTDLDGKPRNLEAYLGDGKWTVVMIWASDCHICNQEAHQYVDFHTFHKDKDARVLGVTMDGKNRLGAAKQFIERHSVNFPNLIGEPEDVAGMYAEATGQYLQGTPSFIVFDPQGKVRAADAGAIPAQVIGEFIANNSGS